MNYRKKRDANESAICKAVRAIPGRTITVQTIEGATNHKGQLLPPAGCPDVIAGFSGRVYLVEIKDIGKRTVAAQSRTPLRELRTIYARLTDRLTEARARLMSPAQLQWAHVWAGSPVHCVTSAQEFAAVLGLCLRCGILDRRGLCDRCGVN
jgi:hypothetical protein